MQPLNVVALALSSSFLSKIFHSRYVLILICEFGMLRHIIIYVLANHLLHKKYATTFITIY